MDYDFPFLCFDTEDNSIELGRRIRRGDKSASFFDKKTTQIYSATAQGETYYNKGDVKEFLKYLERVSNPALTEHPIKYAYALNIQYDLGNFFGKNLDPLDATFVGGRMIKAIYGRIIFVDVFNLWQMSVKNLGNVFSLEKLETDSMSEDKAYIIRDVEIIREACLYVWRFAREIGLENVPPTLGSLGVALWKHWGGETVHESAEICRDAIYGGRVELFKSGNRYKDKPSTVAYTDINSLYPFAMTKAFPGPLEDTGSDIKDFGVVQATVKVKEQEIMVLPYRDPKGKIYYPYGTFTGVWTVAELREAERSSYKIDTIHNCYTTDESLFPYRDYVQRIYKIRLASKTKVEKTFYKLLMNTVYGRIGNTGRIGRTVWQSEENRHKGVPYGERVLIDYPMPLGEEVNWGHAAHVTSYGRLELLKYLRAVGAENLIYCDTDSVIFDSSPEGALPFVTGDGLGEMKIELSCSVCRDDWHDSKEKPLCPGAVKNPRYDICIPWAPKQYKLNEQFKAKGVPKAKQKEFIETGKTEFDLPFKFREAVRWFDRGNVKRLSVWHTIEKHNNAHYDKKKLGGKNRDKTRFYPCKITDV